MGYLPSPRHAKIAYLGAAATLVPDTRAEPSHHASADLIILLNMMGGATHIDSSILPDAPEEIRSEWNHPDAPGVRWRGDAAWRVDAALCLREVFA